MKKRRKKRRLRRPLTQWSRASTASKELTSWTFKDPVQHMALLLSSRLQPTLLLLPSTPRALRKKSLWLSLHSLLVEMPRRLSKNLWRLYGSTEPKKLSIRSTISTLCSISWSTAVIQRIANWTFTRGGCWRIRRKNSYSVHLRNWSARWLLFTSYTQLSSPIMTPGMLQTKLNWSYTQRNSKIWWMIANERWRQSQRVSTHTSLA